MKKLLLALAVVGCALSAGRQANAEFIFQSFSQGSTLTDWGPEPTPLPDIDQFDPSLGTLTSVVITIDAGANGAYELKNNSGTTKAVTSSFGANVRTEGLNGLVLSTSPTIGPFADSIAAGATVGHAGAGNGSNSITLTLPADLAPYIGTGTFTMSLFAEGALDLAGNLVGISIEDFEVFASGTVGITYFYEAVVIPEPSTLVLFGTFCGPLAIGLMVRRRSRKTVA